MLRSFASAALAFVVSATAFAQTPQLEGGRWKLYGVPDAVPNEFCDVHHVLTLDTGSQIGDFGLLEQGLNGFCEIYVPRNPRFFNLVLDSTTACGGKVWIGEIETIDSRTEVKVIDYRLNLCDQSFPLITVEQKDAFGTGPTTKLYTPERG